MLVAVTGATGLVGRYLVRQLLADGQRVRAWYRPASDRSEMPAEVEWVEGHLGEDDATRRLVRGADAVVHAAVDWSERGGDILAFLDTNFMGSIQLLAAARSAGVGRFLYVASCAVHEVS